MHPDDTPPYPVGLRLAARRVVVLGGGTVAQRRLPALLAAGADVHLIAPHTTPAVQAMGDAGELTWHARPYAAGDRTNWDLSADRANATRRFLEQNGLPESRVASVSGNADRELLLPDQPLAAANRRIAIVVLRQAATPPPSVKSAPVILAPPTPAPAPPAKN